MTGGIVPYRRPRVRGRADLDPVTPAGRVRCYRWIRPDGASISPQWRSAHKVADCRLLLGKAHVDVCRLSHEPSAQKFPEYRFEVIHHRASRLMSRGRSRIEQFRKRFLDLVCCSRGHIHVENDSVGQHRDLGIAKQLDVPERRCVEISDLHKGLTAARRLGSQWNKGRGNSLAGHGVDTGSRTLPQTSRRRSLRST